MNKKINSYLKPKKMKKLMILLFTMASLAFVNQQEEKITIKATFDGFEEGIYYFTDEEDESFYFETISKEALAKYNLLKEEFIGESFEVTYKIETKTDEYEEEYESYTIVKLKLIEQE
ncbi:hypothetical protein [Lutibacter sp.]|uniref:hypothetical protein n=1 Tax=Lutibacter sp. TaxID=1925666 RepID=UPI0034A03D10